jgi:Uma2 family endonuclease
MLRPASGKPPDDPPDNKLLPRGPSKKVWAAMSKAQREAFLDEVLAALSDPQELMSEGRPHSKAKSRALDELTLYFSRIGRRIYLAPEMAVVYPDEDPFSPDILAVLDVDQPEEDERMAWVVADENRGLDLVLEILHHGNRDKDLNINVDRYASLGIQEYFVYDRLNFQIHGFRLPSRSATRYREIRPRLGRYTSAVLGLDLAIVQRQLRFFAGDSELVNSTELISRLTNMMSDAEQRLNDAEQRLTSVMNDAEQRGIMDLCEVLGIEVSAERRAFIDAQDLAGLAQLRAYLKQHRRWPQ